MGLLTPPGPTARPPTPTRPQVGPSDPYRTCRWAFRPLPDLWVGLRYPPGPPGGHPDPSQTSGWAYRPLLDLRVGLQLFPDLRVRLTTPLGILGCLKPPIEPAGGPPDPCRPLLDLRVSLLDHYQTFGWSSRPLPEPLVCLPSPSGPPSGPHNPSRTLRVGLSTHPGPPG